MASPMPLDPPVMSAARSAIVEAAPYRGYAGGVLSLVRRLRLAAVPAACCALLLGACGEKEEEQGKTPAPPPAPRAEDFPAPAGRTLSQIGRELGPGPVLAPSVSLLEPGRNRFGFALFDNERRQLGAVPAAVYVAPKTGGKVGGPY